MAMLASEVQKKEFNPNDHLMQIKSKEGNKDYLPVQWRLVWFRALCPQGIIETEMLQLDWNAEFSEDKWVWDNSQRKNVLTTVTGKGVALFRAIVKDGMGGVATGTKSEKGVSFPDFIEKAETGAIGRALAALGYGTQFTGDELNEGSRIADSPVDSGKERQSSQPKQLPARKPQEEESRDPTIRAASDALYNAALANKQKAMQAHVIQNDSMWLALLDHLGISEFKTPKDIQTLNTDIRERIGQQPAQATA